MSFATESYPVAPQSTDRKIAEASLDHLYRIFTASEEPDSTLARIDREISANLQGFLQENIVASDRQLTDLELDFSTSRIPEQPTFVSDHVDFLLKKLVAESVHTAAPGFIGHMTSAFPYFMLPLSRIMVALNQNVVKTETSKAFTPMEREVIAMLHHLVYGMDEAFYRGAMHNSERALGAFCSGGTIANLTALWTARNHLLRPKPGFRGVREEGLAAALQSYGYRGAALVVSERGHYSLIKAADLLGIGRDQLVGVETDAHNRIDLHRLRETLESLRRDNIKVVSLIGIAGTTETGNIDPLDAMADLAREYDCHFHVDAAWGGPTLMSSHYRHLLKGIERADSVSMDAHKQLYVPMGAGLVLFREPRISEHIVQHANYIIREGSKDLGSTSLEGSRAGMAMLVYSGLHIIGRQGYELLIDQGIERARIFARMIADHPDFELITEPELNILTYRYVGASNRELLEQNPVENGRRLNPGLNQLNRNLQRIQRETGKTFVSRTILRPLRYDRQEVHVLRAVLANPLTTPDILEDVLAQQCELVETLELGRFLNS